MGYYEVPAGVLEDPDELARWAWKAAAAAGKKTMKKAGRIKANRKKAPKKN